jgi:PAS domain S-box-containing protein
MMSEKSVEVILMRQLAGYLATPILVVDPAGTLVYFNESAERLLGQRFDETGEMPADAWSAIFSPTDLSGVPLPAEELPILAALAERRPAHRAFWIRGLDGHQRYLEVMVFPLIGLEDRDLGAVATVWEAQP